MTDLTRLVRRETAVSYRGRNLVIELHPGYLKLYERGRKDSVIVDYAAVYELGMRIQVRDQGVDVPVARKVARRGTPKR